MTETPEQQSELKSRVLARFVADTRYEDIPEAIREKAVRHILDSVGAAVAGAVSDEASKLLSVLPRSSGPGSAGSWGFGERLSAPDAAFVTGTAAHAFELDDTGGCDHSGAVVIPALFAAAEIAARPVTGKEVIEAMVLGYEIARRPLEACGAYEPHNGAGFHSTGTCGPFGAAAAAAKILKLDADQIQNAIGIASSFSGGLWSCVHNGAQNKRLHAGHAAWGGVMAALLARTGFTGPDHVFEEVWGGFNHSFAPTSSDPDAYLRDLGRVWKLGRVSIKPHAACRSAHSSIDAVDILRAKHGFKAEDVEKIVITINPLVYGMCGGYATEPINAAQLSIPYSVAVDMVLGNASLPSFAAKNRRDRRILDFMKRIEFIVDKSQADDEEPQVEVRLKTGESFREHVQWPLGAPQNPVTDEALLTKFKSVAGMTFRREAVDEIADLLMKLPEIEDVNARLIPLLGAKANTPTLFKDRN